MEALIMSTSMASVIKVLDPQSSPAHSGKTAPLLNPIISALDQWLN